MSSTVRFGTDGIRGRAFQDITPGLAYRLGRAVAEVLPSPVYVGYDTRESSPVLARAVLAGLRDGGVLATNLGVFTTPGVAVIAQRRGGCGIVVSASHNPYYDNGLKVLGPGGGKLDVPTERALEAAVNATAEPTSYEFADSPIEDSAEAEYVGHLRSLIPDDLSSLHVVLDCANGASFHVAHELFVATGARVTTLYDQPDGVNINNGCGSTHPDTLARTVVELGADLGLAFDGDADRLIAVDAEGRLRDGDDVMVLFGLDHERVDRGLVVTTMSNLGLRRAMERVGIEVVETDVGDRNVLLGLEERGWLLGGEQSGHIIFRDLSPTGDGLLTGLKLAALVARRGPLGVLCDQHWVRLPQELVNVGADVYDDASARGLFESIRRRHGVNSDDVRLIIRRSGTEPLVRVMFEATSEILVREYAESLRELFDLD
jgi:phosphoglucosamine mutase